MQRPLPEPAEPPRPDRDVEAHEWQRAHASLELARATGQAFRLCEALAALSRIKRRAGWPQDAAEALDEALRWASVLGSIDTLVDLLCERGELAMDTACDSDTPVAQADADLLLQARACAAEAASLAHQVSCPDWEVKVLLRASDLFNRLGHNGEAVALQARALLRMNAGTAPQADGHGAPGPVAVTRPVKLQ